MAWARTELRGQATLVRHGGAVRRARHCRLPARQPASRNTDHDPHSKHDHGRPQLRHDLNSAWPYFAAGLDAAIAVSDDAARRAAADLAALGISSGPSGAASLAGARAALTGPASAGRRAELGVNHASVIVLLNTEAAHPPQ